MIFQYLEDVESISPQSASFSWSNAGRATSRYQVTFPNGSPLAVADMASAVNEVLGQTQISQNNGFFQLNRFLPLAHPIYPWLYASEVVDFRGYGSNGLQSAASMLESPAISDQYYRYAKYYMTITFTSRPYAVLSNAQISNTSEAVVNFNNINKTITGATEWLRYCDWEPISQPDSVTATQGEMYFRDPNLAVGGFLGIGGQPPRYPGMLRMFLNNQLIKFTWYQVPMSYVTSPNSYIQSFRGRINQTAWNYWNAAELLYLDYRIKRYTPPVPQLQTLQKISGNVFDDPLTNTFSTSKSVDIEFSFLDTVRVAQPNNTYTPKNGNWIAAGHNLLPYWINRNYFYYATTFNKGDGANPAGSDETQWYPSWLSVPFSLLFTNPDAGQPQAPLGFPN